MASPVRVGAFPQDACASADPFLDAAHQALVRAQERLQETAATYFAAAPVGLAEARQAYYDALTEHADAEQRLLHARLRTLR